MKKRNLSRGIQLPKDEIIKNMKVERNINTKAYWKLTDFKTWK